MHEANFFYLPSSQNKNIFIAHYFPLMQDASRTSRSVILIPPFAEEMNRSKRMYVLCAQQLANLGFNVFIFDFSGTGDSEGGWGEFEYEDWIGNLKDVFDYVNCNIDSCVDLIALRFGVFLAIDTIIQKKINIGKCVFWDPIDKGENYIRQLIRTKIVADMGHSQDKKSMGTILEEMERTGHIEIAGYKINKGLVNIISQANLVDKMKNIISAVSVNWLQLGTESIKPAWLADSIFESVNFRTIDDIRFWMQQEVTISQQLLMETSKIFKNGE